MTGKALSTDVRILAPRPPLGWPLLQVPDESGSWRWPDLAQSLKNQIYVILKTKPGEQLMNPEFGAGLENELHEPDGLVTRARIRDLITKNLQDWESRIIVDAITVDASPRDGREVLIGISYRSRFNAMSQTLALAMPLGRA
jgi:uncharacterized protein